MSKETKCWLKEIQMTPGQLSQNKKWFYYNIWTIHQIDQSICVDAVIQVLMQIIYYFKLKTL